MRSHFFFFVAFTPGGTGGEGKGCARAVMVPPGYDGFGQGAAGAVRRDAPVGGEVLLPCTEGHGMGA